MNKFLNKIYMERAEIIKKMIKLKNETIKKLKLLKLNYNNDKKEILNKLGFDRMKIYEQNKRILDLISEFNKKISKRLSYRKPKILEEISEIYLLGLKNNTVRKIEETRAIENKEIKTILEEEGIKECIKHIIEKVLKEVYSKENDFFPTPDKCIEDLEINLKYVNNILEPCAGLGHLINIIRKLKKNDEYKITANELSKNFSIFLELFNPDIEIFNEDFLKTKIKNPEYELILINPPFTNRTDKRFYYDFLFKCLRILQKTKKFNAELIFISPKITNKTMNKKNNIFELYDIINNSYLSKTKLKNLTGTTNFDDLERDYDFAQSQFIGKCKFSNIISGTNIETDIYLIIGYKKS